MALWCHHIITVTILGHSSPNLTTCMLYHNEISCLLGIQNFQMHTVRLWWTKLCGGHTGCMNGDDELRGSLPLDYLCGESKRQFLLMHARGGTPIEKVCGYALPDRPPFLRPEDIG